MKKAYLAVTPSDEKIFTEEASAIDYVKKDIIKNWNYFAERFDLDQDVFSALSEFDDDKDIYVDDFGCDIEWYVKEIEIK